MLVCPQNISSSFHLFGSFLGEAAGNRKSQRTTNITIFNWDVVERQENVKVLEKHVKS